MTYRNKLVNLFGEATKESPLRM